MSNTHKLPLSLAAQPTICLYVLTLTPAERAALKHQRPRCLWLTGLSGAGKSTLANALEVALHRRGQHTFLLDGDNLRNGLCSDLGMSAQDRQENIRRTAHTAKLMVEAGLLVIVSAISPFDTDRKAARSLFGRGEFALIYVDTPFSVCARRDPKGLYQAALSGRISNFTGLDSPYECPADADLQINTEMQDEAVAVQTMLRFLSNS